MAGLLLTIFIGVCEC